MDEAEKLQPDGVEVTDARATAGHDLGPTTLGETIDHLSEQTPLIQASNTEAASGSPESAETVVVPRTATADAPEPDSEVANLSQQIEQNLELPDSASADQPAENSSSPDAANEPGPEQNADAAAEMLGGSGQSDVPTLEPKSADAQPHEQPPTNEQAPARSDVNTSQATEAAEADSQEVSETVGATETELPISAEAEKQVAVDSEPPAAESAEPPKRASVHSATSSHDAPEQPSETSKPPVAAELAETAAAQEPDGVAAEHAAAPGELTHGGKHHKETPLERLTEPTAMRMLKTLQETQGDTTEWHIATGVVYKGKKLNADEMSAMVDRLCVPKHADDNMPAKPHAVKLVYVNNKETYEPVKEATKEENINYMSELYSRCQETRSKTRQQLADKYLQPLVKPKEKSSSPAKATSPKKGNTEQPSA